MRKFLLLGLALCALAGFADIAHCAADTSGLPVRRAQPQPDAEEETQSEYRGRTPIDERMNSQGARNLQYRGDGQGGSGGRGGQGGRNGTSPYGQAPAYYDEEGRAIYYDETGRPFYYVKNDSKSDDELLEDAAREYRARTALERRLDNEAAFERDFDAQFPFTPQQIKKARRQQIKIGEAMQLPVPNEGVTRSQVVSLRPGAKNGVIHLYPQYATTIRVLDSAGNPWPIMAHMIGNASNFQVQKPDMEPYDTIIVSPLTSMGSTNLVLMLDNNDGEDPVPPLALQLVVSPDFGNQYDTVASIRVDRKGPRAPAPVTIDDSANFNTDSTMLSFLDGVPPKDALRLKTNDRNVDAWEYNDMLYVRSPRKIVWPAWTKQIASGEKSGQIFAYELPMVPSVMFSGNRSVKFGRYSNAVSRLMQGEQ